MLNRNFTLEVPIQKWTIHTISAAVKATTHHIGNDPHFVFLKVYYEKTFTKTVYFYFKKMLVN